MPIILNDTQNIQVQAKNKAKPSYFDKDLTGAGKSTGLLNKNLKPAGPSDKVEPLPVNIGDVKRTRQDGLKKYKAIPMHIINVAPNKELCLVNIENLPEDAEDVSDPASGNPCWLYVTAAGCVLETEQGDPSARKLHTRYYVTLFTVQPKSDPSEPDRYRAMTRYTEDLMPASWFLSHADQAKIENYFDGLTVYDTIVNAAACWQKNLPAALSCWLAKRPGITEVFDLVQRINEYQVDLTDYWKIYDILKAQTAYGTDFLDKCCDRNLNLRLNNKLQTAQTVKPQVAVIKGRKPYKPSGIQPSIEQMAAITSEEPYVIVQSGAGVGKSFTIQHRLRYMEESGEDMSKVVVLSFTNAAADHIHDIAPTVNSKTIASMILDIYNANFKHKLSQPDTILNMLDASRQIRANQNLRSVKLKLEDALLKLRKNVNSGMMMLASLAKEHYDDLVRILDIIGQTTLELQAAICYTADGKLKEPVIGCNHIIMDEVQDSSIFEFIYIIGYAIRHKSTLYFIGDGSQTLYEFRASNPKAMNCLESSGLFHCLKLQTNYRSNQNILDFANLSLKEIEANQFAGIQLMANAFHVDRFEQNVQLEYTQARTLKDKDDAMLASLGKAQPWIQDKLAKNEQVCILAYTRKNIAKCKTAITAMFPDRDIIDITPAKTYNDTFFSKYVCKLGENYTHRVTADATTEITRHMIDNVNLLCMDYQKDRLKELLDGWRSKYKQPLAAADVRLQAGNITPARFKEEVLQTLIDYEVDHNAILSRVVTMKNAQKKTADISAYPFVFSTIHSAKGLEFDNVVLVYDEDKSSAEDEKRMYYVALTRAKSAEYIIATGCTVSSRIQTAYETMLTEKKKALAKKAADKAAAAPGAKPKIRFLLPKVNASCLLGKNGMKLPNLDSTKQTA